jgi:hypothetical protein
MRPPTELGGFHLTVLEALAAMKVAYQSVAKGAIGHALHLYEIGAKSLDTALFVLKSLAELEMPVYQELGLNADSRLMVARSN